MSTTIVNGYVCFNCSDQAKAQKGIDPANPTNDPSQNKSVLTQKAEALAIAKAEAAKHSAFQQNGAFGQSNTGGNAGNSSLPLPSAVLLAGVGGGLDITA